MHTNWIILGLLIAGAGAAVRQRKRFAWLRELTGWQKAFGVLALVTSVIIMANPEFICLGLLGDTAFFDLLVLALSLQMHGIASGLWRRAVSIFGRSLRRLAIPSPGLLYLMCIWTFVIVTASNAIQKLLTRIS